MALLYKRNHTNITALETSEAQDAEHTNDWSNFRLPDQLPVSHPYLSRYSPSTLLTSRAIASNSLNTTLTGIYGNPSHPIAFTIGNGGAGYTNFFRSVCTNFIWTYGGDFRIGWIANHSRHNQIALLGDIVQVSLTYEPEWEAVMEEEGWGRVVRPEEEGKEGGEQVFWDHFVLAGPKEDPAGLGGEGGLDVREALRRLAKGGQGVRFLTRGDGSATFNKEQQFWKDIGVDPAALDCVETHPLPPYKALQQAEESGAYLLSDRSTFLTAKRDGIVPKMRVYVEGGDALLNPCSASVNTRVPDSVSQRLAVRFAEWMGEERAQSVCTGYGRVWEPGFPLFTNKDRKEFGDEELLVGKDL